MGFGIWLGCFGFGMNVFTLTKRKRLPLCVLACKNALRQSGGRKDTGRSKAHQHARHHLSRECVFDDFGQDPINPATPKLPETLSPSAPRCNNRKAPNRKNPKAINTKLPRLDPTHRLLMVVPFWEYLIGP